MLQKHTHRYSFLLLPIIYLLDSILIFLFVNHFHFEDKSITYFIALNIIWFVISYFTKFYEVYRNTKPAEIISKTLKQVIIFDLTLISFFHLLKISESNRFLIKSLLIFNIALFFFKLLIYIFLKFYRAKGGNTRLYLIVGYNDETLKFRDILDTRVDYGYKFDSFFGNEKNPNIQGNIQELKSYLDKNPVDVIFCSLKECSDEQIKDIIVYADNHFMSVKFIPDNKEILGKNLKIDYFDYFPVLSLNKSPLDKPVNKIFKRGFDIFFSLIIILTVLWWLIPLIGLFIKLESKGPILFKQKRNGINYETFKCYKFRSMRPNKLADIIQVRKDDDRITGIGKILRKTSVDELPQFINVLKGDMSVVGPRPHMVNENERFLKRIDKFMGRHYIKPGITGLAQIRLGYADDGETVVRKARLDHIYATRHNIRMDGFIILHTFRVILTGFGAK